MSPRAQAAYDLIRLGESTEENSEDLTNLSSRFQFFANYEERMKEKEQEKKKPFQLPSTERTKVVEAVLAAKPLRPKCMAYNCAVCKLRVIDLCVDFNFISTDSPLVEHLRKRLVFISESS